MPRMIRVQYFDSEGRENLLNVVKDVKNYLRAKINDGETVLPKLVFLTGQGEGPMIAYNQLGGLDVQIIAVTFPRGFYVRVSEKDVFYPQIPDRVRKFFNGVEIPVITARLPFDPISGAESHNREMKLLRDALALFGGSIPLAIQAVLQATDCGLLETGEEAVAITSDTAAVITASTTDRFLSKTCGLAVNEIICKPRNFNISRRTQPTPQTKELMEPALVPQPQQDPKA